MNGEKRRERIAIRQSMIACAILQTSVWCHQPTCCRQLKQQIHIIGKRLTLGVSPTQIHEPTEMKIVKRSILFFARHNKFYEPVECGVQNIAAEDFIEHGIDVLISEPVKSTNLILLSSLLSFVVVKSLFPLGNVEPEALVQIIPHFGDVIFLKLVLIGFVH